MLSLLPDFTRTLSPLAYACAAAAAVLLWTVGCCIYNVYFHPLSRFPGPKWAAATIWWRVYHEVFTDENTSETLQQLHGRYGDIIRIGPNELHFSRPEVYHEIYNSKNRWNKDPYLYHIFADAESTVSICDYDKAKKRRDLALPLFSRRSIIKMQDAVQQCADTMCENIDSIIRARKPVNFHRAYRCFSVDAVMLMCFGASADAAKEPDFRSPIEHAMYAGLELSLLFKHFPLVQRTLARLPVSIAERLNPEFKGYFQMRKMLNDQVRTFLTRGADALDAYQDTIYYRFVVRKDGGAPIPEAELCDEAFVFVNAGTDTVSDALSVGTLNVLGQPAVRARLQAALRAAWPDPERVPRYEDLEGIPYLRAVIKESLRFAQGVIHPMTRMVPPEGTVLSGAYIPGGTAVAISNLFVHTNADIFPDPHVFRPERWLGDAGASLDNWLVAFSKGPHQCLGMNLAYCELYVGFANLFRRYDLKLDNVSAKDWTFKDCYLPHYEGPDLSAWLTPAEA